MEGEVLLSGELGNSSNVLNGGGYNLKGTVPQNMFSLKSGDI